MELHCLEEGNGIGTIEFLDKRGEKRTIAHSLAFEDRLWVGSILVDQEMMAELLPYLQRFALTGLLFEEK